ncbi:MAG: tRNA (N(6)-L-threonylcarbamoyladenosine(37)-C(2))-methylthiotransferase MtaB [Bacillota bacterium]
MNEVAFYTLGCKVNQYDTEGMIKSFAAADYEIVDFEEQADVYVINTCTVTHQGASKSRKIVRQAKRRNPEAVVAVVGCYPQVDAAEVLEIDGVDLVVGTTGRQELVNLVKQAKLSAEPLNYVQDVSASEEFEELEIDQSRERTRASMKVEDGCDSYCAYCIIPYTRGSVRSRKLSDAVSEAKRLVANGFQEIVLTGIHLGAYGRDLTDIDLVALIEELIEIEGLARIRLSSIEATEVSSELIDLIANEGKLCRHLHLPLQSGSDEVLAAMNRDYTTAEFRAKVEEIRNKVPQVAITTDVIVGFPGASDKDFAATYQFVEEIGFSDLHVFKYSKRDGTPAAKFADQVHSKVKKKRSAELRELGSQLADNYRQQFVGEELKVLLEDQRDNYTGLLTGLTDNYLRVKVDDEDQYCGQLVDVKLNGLENDYLLGQII